MCIRHKLQHLFRHRCVGNQQTVQHLETTYYHQNHLIKSTPPPQLHQLVQSNQPILYFTIYFITYKPRPVLYVSTINTVYYYIVPLSTYTVIFNIHPPFHPIFKVSAVLCSHRFLYLLQRGHRRAHRLGQNLHTGTWPLTVQRRTKV